MWLAQSYFRSAPQCPMGPFPAQKLHAWTIPMGEEKGSGAPWLPAIFISTIHDLVLCLVQALLDKVSLHITLTISFSLGKASPAVSR